MFGILVDSCKNIIEIIKENEKIDRETKDRISTILERISKIIDDTANSLINDIYPHGNCLVMEHLANSLHFQLMDYFEQDEVDKLHKIMIECSNLEKEYSDRKNPDTIKNLQIAAGEFESMSLLLKF